MCGGVASECLDPKVQWEGRDPVRCYRTTTVAIKQKQYYDAIPEGSDVQGRALIWGAKRRP